MTRRSRGEAIAALLAIIAIVAASSIATQFLPEPPETDTGEVIGFR